MTPGFSRSYSGASWEQRYGYCRALRAGPWIFVTGTAPVAEGGGIAAPGDAYAQTRRCYEIIESALKPLGSDRKSIVRCRLFVTDINRAEEYGAAHRDFFAGHHPCLTMVGGVQLIDPQMLVEIEAEAVAPHE